MQIRYFYDSGSEQQIRIKIRLGVLRVFTSGKKNVSGFIIVTLFPVSRLLHKDVLDLTLAFRYSAKQDKNEPNHNNYRCVGKWGTSDKTLYKL
jgi:hypothetical protein